MRERCAVQMKIMDQSNLIALALTTISPTMPCSQLSTLFFAMSCALFLSLSGALPQSHGQWEKLKQQKRSSIFRPAVTVV